MGFGLKVGGFGKVKIAMRQQTFQRFNNTQDFAFDQLNRRAVVALKQEIEDQEKKCITGDKAGREQAVGTRLQG